MQLQWNTRFISLSHLKHLHHTQFIYYNRFKYVATTVNHLTHSLTFTVHCQSAAVASNLRVKAWTHSEGSKNKISHTTETRKKKKNNHIIFLVRRQKHVPMTWNIWKKRKIPFQCSCSLFCVQVESDLFTWTKTSQLCWRLHNLSNIQTRKKKKCLSDEEWKRRRRERPSSTTTHTHRCVVCLY